MGQLPKLNTKNEDLSGEVSQDVDLFVLSLTGPFHVYFQHLFINSVSSITDFSKDSTLLSDLKSTNWIIQINPTCPMNASDLPTIKTTVW